MWNHGETVDLVSPSDGEPVSPDVAVVPPPDSDGDVIMAGASSESELVISVLV